MLLTLSRSTKIPTSTYSMMANESQTEFPPAYEHSEEYEYLLDAKSKDLLLPSESIDYGFAASSTLTRGLQVPSRSGTCSSGFDYPEELMQHNITKEQWSQFTQVIQDEAKLSRGQWTTVVGKGLGTLAIGGLMIGFLGAIPAVFVARHIRRRKEQKNLKESMTGDQDQHLAHHISHWNETFFRPRGLLIRVDLPKELVRDMKNMDIHLEPSGSQPESEARDRAALKARVVIIPVEGSISESSRA